MKKSTLPDIRFYWMQKITVAILCAYYYLSLFRQSSDILGFDVAQSVSVLLWLFFGSVLVQLLFNFHAIYALYISSRIRFIIVLLFVVIFTALTQQSWLLIPFLLYLVFYNSGSRYLAKQLFIFSLICYAAVIVLGIALPDLGREVIDKSYSVASIVSANANSLGFPNSNNSLLCFTIITMNGAYLFKSRNKRKLYSLVMLVFATILFILTLSVTGYICILIFLSIYALADANLLRVTRVAIPIIAIAAIVLTPLIALRYGQNDTNLVNSTLSNRPYLWNLRVSEGAYQNIIGNSDNYRSSEDKDRTGYTLDNQYLQLIARYGWVVLLIFFYIYFTGIQKMSHPALISGLLALSIYFVAEAVMFIMVLNVVPIIALGYKISDQSNKEIEMQHE